MMMVGVLVQRQADGTFLFKDIPGLFDMDYLMQDINMSYIECRADVLFLGYCSYTAYFLDWIAERKYAKLRAH